MRVGVTGHIRLADSATAAIYESLVRTLRGYRCVRGITCFAPGADQLFARAVRAVGGTFEVVLPHPAYLACQRYRARREGWGGDWRQAAALFTQASRVLYLPGRPTDENVYARAGRQVLARSQMLLAVWDGKPSVSPGGTAQMIECARRLGVPTTVIWPDGARRR